VSLLYEIQAAAVNPEAALGPLLLKLRLLAAKLDSKPLEDWVKWESEGYPRDIEVPDYRVIGVSYTGSFIGPFGSGYRNIAIPPHFIKELAGEDWLDYKFRDGVATIDDFSEHRTDASSIQLSNAANLALLLADKVFDGHNCVNVTGIISPTQLAAIQHAVRSKVLELTVQIENEIPAAADIVLGKQQMTISNEDSKRASDVSQKIIYGDYTEIHNSGDRVSIEVNVTKGSSKEFVDALVEAGIAKSDAEELASIVKAEKPQSAKEPLGKKAQDWLARNLSKAAGGVWKATTTVATTVITEAALKYYGFK
jgi:hypothetical protein